MRFKDLDKEVFRQSVESGTTDKVLADCYEVSEKTILRWREQLGIKPNWEARRYGCGTSASYARGCRCGECREAATERHRNVTMKMRENGLAHGDDRHGTVLGYRQWGCRCGLCREAGRKSNRAYYVRQHGEALRVPRWSDADDELVRTCTPAEAAELTGRSMSAVYQRRQRLGVAVQR